MTLPPGRLRLATRPSLTGSSPVVKTMGIVVVAALAAGAAGCRGRDNDRHLATNQIGRQCRQTIDIDPPPSDIRSPRSDLRHSRLPSGLGGTRPRRRVSLWRCAVEEPDHRHRRLLRARRERPRAAAPPISVMNSRRCSGRDVRFMARPPHRTVRAAFPHTAPTSGV